MLYEGVISGNRRALAQAITLLESTNPDHETAASELLAKLTPHSGKSMRVGISGAPGAGKSTFIESLGLHVLAREHKLAVLAVDPTSKRSGGSILGDKTRMEELSKNDNAFIRPSPAGGALGGIGNRSREALVACEAAGFDVIFVETVGVGQSETAVADMTDLFLLLLSPAGGDELQGMKKGIVEIADIVLVNKADGDFKKSACIAASNYQSAIRMLRPNANNWEVPVLTCSALNNTGIDEIWKVAEKWRSVMTADGTFARVRQKQAGVWLWDSIRERFEREFRLDMDNGDELNILGSKVANGEMTAPNAALALIRRFRGGKPA
ncbi:MAG: methylmalonyl Co-A mutase-associated GTPase MeaB [Pseudomonadota bacterium]|nr:methylmalonyl Co-A mutase-associated GTPase MeaB [Pseudomonadota bacterium]